MRLIDRDALEQQLLDLCVNRSDARMDGTVQYLPRGKAILDILAAQPVIGCETCRHAPCDSQWCPSMSLYEPKEQP